MKTFEQFINDGFNYKVVTPNKKFDIKKFFDNFKENIDNLSESKNVNELIKKLNKIFKETNLEASVNFSIKDLFLV